LILARRFRTRRLLRLTLRLRALLRLRLSLRLSLRLRFRARRLLTGFDARSRAALGARRFAARLSPLAALTAGLLPRRARTAVVPLLRE
jgi:hypothetical protein